MAKALSPLDFNFDFGTVSKLWLADLRVLYGWYSHNKSDLRRLRRVVRTAERIIGTTLPTLQELYLSRVSKRAGKITLDPSHPAHSFFELLPSGRRYRALSTRTTRHRNSFFPQAIHLMNTTLNVTTQHYNIIIYSSHILIFSFQRGGGGGSN